MEDGIELVTVIEQLRGQLAKLTEKVKFEDLHFKVDSVEVELKVAVAKGGEAGVTAKFLVVEVGGKGNYKVENTHTIKLKLIPKQQSEPGGEVLVSSPGVVVVPAG